MQVGPLKWIDVQGWAGMGGTKLGTTRFAATDYVVLLCCLQCFDAVGWAAGRVSSLYKTLGGCRGGGTVSPVGVASTRTIGTSASIIFPCSIKIQKTVGKTSLNAAQPHAKGEGRVFLLVPAYPGCPGTKAVKRLLLLLLLLLLYYVKTC